MLQQVYGQPELGLVDFFGDEEEKKGQRVNRERIGSECDQGTVSEIPKYK